jgi:hypothetical protein
MAKLYTEEQMASTERQVSGNGAGSTDQPLSNVSVPTKGTDSINIKPLLPFEIQVVISEIGDIFVRMCELRKQFEGALNNPSIDNVRKTVLETIIDDKIDKINQVLLSIPILLNKMHSRRGNSIRSSNAKDN